MAGIYLLFAICVCHKGNQNDLVRFLFNVASLSFAQDRLTWMCVSISQWNACSAKYFSLIVLPKVYFVVCF